MSSFLGGAMEENEMLLSKSQAAGLLAAMSKETHEILEWALSRTLCARDHLFIAGLNRSIANIDGFLLLLDQKNLFCAVPIIRFQLDSAMRLHACSLVKDVDEYVNHVLEGKPPSQYKDRDGNSLRDAYLHGKLSAKYEEVSRIYHDTSGYAHLSDHHLFGIVDRERSEGDKVDFHDLGSLIPRDETSLRSRLTEMVWATHVLLEECKVWQGETSVADWGHKD